CSGDRLTALCRASASVITPISGFSSLSRPFIASINGEAHTNEPIALLLTGLFDDRELSQAEPDPSHGIYAPSTLIQFGRNDLLYVYEAVTETGIHILETA